MKTVRDINKTLFQLAEPQQGLFTAQQAEEAGFIRTNHAYHVKNGNWIREERGIYRLALYPDTKDQQRAVYALWSRNRDGEVQGVYSHETALAFHELSDANPSKLHLTVPTSFRRRASAPRVLILHRADLEKKDTQAGPGYRVTTPIRTIEDLLVSGKVSFELIEQAIDEALVRGLITKSELRAVVSGLPERSPFSREITALMKKLQPKGGRQ